MKNSGARAGASRGQHLRVEMARGDEGRKIGDAALRGESAGVPGDLAGQKLLRAAGLPHGSAPLQEIHVGQRRSQRETQTRTSAQHQNLLKKSRLLSRLSKAPLRAEAIDLSEAPIYRKGMTRGFRAIAMVCDFICQSPLGPRKIPAGHMLVEDPISKERSGVRTDIFFQTYFYVPEPA